jgi:NAD(P)-dependent dehydrogenase (short-subunit alcohol dehydrogenase family)
MTGEDHIPTGRVWLITGASRGLGREFAQAAPEAGDTVVLTARDPRALEPLADRPGAQRVVARATERFGRRSSWSQS